MIEYHNLLNPQLWDNDTNQLKIDVKEKLTQIYTTFITKLKENDIPLEIIDVLLLGSNAGYNYTNDSDIDVHIITDFNDLGLSPELSQIFYNNEKSKFNNDYDITIKGFDVEMYIEDISSTNISDGVYSLLKDKWLRFPEYNPPKEVDYSKLLSQYQEKIANVLTSDSISDIKNLINDIRMMRKLSLSENGIYSKGNLVFKELRNNGSIDMLYDKLKELTSKELSLENLNK